MSEGKQVTAENLNSVMEFDHVLHIANGIAEDVAESFYFEVTQFKLEDGRWETEYILPEGWQVMRGYTGQHGYNGPDMHNSEFIGGGMARDILEAPGLYVALAISASCGGLEDGCAEDDCTCEGEGWVVAYKLDGE